MSEAGQGGWERWDRFAWNRRLVEFYFTAVDGDSDPVRRIDASWSVLTRLAGVSAASFEHVRDRFLDRIRASLGDEPIGTVLLTRTGPHHGLPTSFVYLFTTCLAASEAQEDSEDEGEVERNFRDALCTMLGSDRHAAGLDKLAEAWERFAEWTEVGEAEGTFRRLILPDQGSETQIGYSKRLAFPRLRDQVRLAQLLDRAGLLMEDPPIDMMVSHLRPLRHQMSMEMQAAFDEFLTSADSLADENSDPRFLMAVNSVARNAGILAGGTTADGSLTVLLLDYADTFELVAAASGPEPFDGAVTVLDDFLPSAWPYRVSEVEGGGDAVTLLLGPSFKSSLSWVLRPGIVPFVAGEQGVPEVLKRGRLEDAGYLLVRSDRLEQLRSAFGISERRVQPSPLEGWSILRDPQLWQLSADQLTDAGLSDVPVLRRRPIRNSLRLKDGYPVLGDLLGFQLTIPWISAPGAIAVTASLDGSELALGGGSGSWRLPDRDLFGALRVRADFAEGKSQERSVSLISEPTGLDYKPPSNETDWMQETLAGTSIYLEARHENVSDTESEIADGVHCIYLGPVVGEFLPSPDGATYELASFGEIKWVRLLNPEATEPPTSRVGDKGLCRRWRKALDEYHPFAETDVVAQAMGRAKAATSDLKTLDVVVSDRGHRMHPDSPPPTNQNCRVVQAAVGSICTRRAGMRIGEWFRLLDRAFSLTERQRRFVHRAWLESGLIDELRQTKWQGSAIFARKPVLLAFRVGSARFGSVDGLVMPSRLAHLRDVASELELSTSLNGSPSPFVPARLMVRSEDPALVEKFAAAAGLEIRFLSADPSASIPRRDVEHREIRRGYQSRRASPTFAPRSGIEMTMHRRPDAPSFWSSEVDGRTIWSYSPEATSFWVRRVNGDEVARLGSGSMLEPVESFLPLSLARWLAVVSGTNPGPASDGRYLNPGPSRILALRVLGLLNSLSSGQTESGATDD